MVDQTSNMPQLTLTPSEAPAPQLVLGNEAARLEAAPEVQPAGLDDSMLTEAEREMVDNFSQKIDITDSQMILEYGSAAQKHVAAFSENALSSIRNKDLGEIGETLTDLVVGLRDFGEEEEKKGLFGLFKRAGDKLETMKAQYSKAEASVAKITRELEQHQLALMKDIAMFDQMYELNLQYYKELTMYILAGKKCLANLQATRVEELRKRAEETGAPEDAQAYNDLVQMCGRFEKKLHDLELTRMVSIQMGPQTRLLQNNDALMVEKIQSSLVNTIPCGRARWCWPWAWRTAAGPPRPRAPSPRPPTTSCGKTRTC